jgi:hypothetical protein
LISSILLFLLSLIIISLSLCINFYNLKHRNFSFVILKIY